MPDHRLTASLAALAVALAGCSESGSTEAHSHGDDADHTHDHDGDHSHDESNSEGVASETEATPASEELGIAIGQTVPNATLTDASGGEISLASLYADGPIVVTFYRGGWCPYCNDQLAELQRRLPEFTEAGARIIALSPESPDETAKTAQKNETSFMILSDASMDAARGFGVLFDLDEGTKETYRGYEVFLDQSNASGEWSLPHAGTFVIDSEGVVRWKWVDTDYSKRADPDEVIDAVQSL